jgi:hypothetical protein
MYPFVFFFKKLQHFLQCINISFVDELDHPEELESIGAEFVYGSDSTASTVYSRSTSSVLRRLGSDIYDFASESDPGVSTTPDSREQQGDLPMHRNCRHGHFTMETSPSNLASSPSSPLSSPILRVPVIRSHRSRQGGMPYMIPNRDE